MPRPRWFKLPEERRTKIHDAVIDEIAEVGLAQASVNRILRSAGFSKGVLYYYFEDRSELLATVVSDIAKRLKPALVTSILETRSVDDFWGAIHAQYSGMVQWLDAHPKLLGVARWATRALTSPSQLPAEFAPFPRQVAPLVRSVLSHGQSLGAIRTDLPIDELLPLTLGVLFTLDIMTMHEDPVSPERAAQRLVDSAQRLLRP